ncbi:hypothetical protein [Ornithinibacillus sp. FSL M8-0202]|uniref:hypothetical protein n=2 Tax=unclassified Ornithinibacillus TaxID=2620869 RepID=UPI0030CE81E4
MILNLNDQIIQVKGKIRQKYKLESQLQDYYSELSEIENTINRLNTQLMEEKADVRRLEGFHIANFFSTITGTKYEKLDKENREVLAVQLQLEEAEKTRDEVMDSILNVQNRLAEVGNSEELYQDLLSKKEHLIKKGHSRYADELYRLSEKEGDIQAYLKEFNEAIQAGQYAEQALHNAQESLSSASKWGTLDMFGGGMISTAIKHSRMDDASEYIHIAQSRMRDFQKELLDIDEMIPVDTDMPGLLKFADFFFDGLIVDWMVQGRINDSIDQVGDQLLQVRRILAKLKTENTYLQNQLANLYEEKIQLIESYR